MSLYPLPLGASVIVPPVRSDPFVLSERPERRKILEPINWLNRSDRPDRSYSFHGDGPISASDRRHYGRVAKLYNPDLARVSEEAVRPEQLSFPCLYVRRARRESHIRRNAAPARLASKSCSFVQFPSSSCALPDERRDRMDISYGTCCQAIQYDIVRSI